MRGATWVSAGSCPCQPPPLRHLSSWEWGRDKAATVLPAGEFSPWEATAVSSWCRANRAGGSVCSGCGRKMVPPALVILSMDVFCWSCLRPPGQANPSLSLQFNRVFGVWVQQGRDPVLTPGGTGQRGPWVLGGCPACPLPHLTGSAMRPTWSTCWGEGGPSPLPTCEGDAFSSRGSDIRETCSGVKVLLPWSCFPRGSQMAPVAEEAYPFLLLHVCAEGVGCS